MSAIGRRGRYLQGINRARPIVSFAGDKHGIYVRIDRFSSVVSAIHTCSRSGKVSGQCDRTDSMTNPHPFPGTTPYPPVGSLFCPAGVASVPSSRVSHSLSNNRRAEVSRRSRFILLNLPVWVRTAVDCHADGMRLNQIPDRVQQRIQARAKASFSASVSAKTWDVRQ